jgi:hypothetical protein
LLVVGMIIWILCARRRRRAARQQAHITSWGGPGGNPDGLVMISAPRQGAATAAAHGRMTKADSGRGQRQASTPLNNGWVSPAGRQGEGRGAASPRDFWSQGATYTVPSTPEYYHDTPRTPGAGAYQGTSPPATARTLRTAPRSRAWEGALGTAAGRSHRGSIRTRADARG